MSYIEHGPRIFCTGRPSNALPLNYGDYVLPRKRSEGRLKMYDSCSDIRAWSPNPMENSRYIRELAERAPRVRSKSKKLFFSLDLVRISLELSTNYIDYLIIIIYSDHFQLETYKS